MKLYYPSADEAAKHWHNADIVEIFDNNNEDYCNKIIANSKHTEKKSRIFCEIEHEIGRVEIRLFKDPSDDVFYDYCDYRITRKNCLVIPVLRTMSTPEKVWKMFFGELNDIKYDVVSFRKYGQPKLDKPKELRGLKGMSVVYIPNHCTNQYFIDDKDLWIKSRDYFSPSYRLTEDIGTPLEYLIKKYGIKSKKSSGFIYNDCWGDIVLRQEAWMRFSNIIPYIGIVPYTELAEMATKKIQDYHHFTDGLDFYWRDMFEHMFKQIKEDNDDQGRTSSNA